MPPKKINLNFLISGAALSGNKGAMAMVTVTLDQLRNMYPDCTISLLSKYPSQDKAACEAAGVALIPAPPTKLVSGTALRSLLMCLLQKVFPVTRLQDSILTAYHKADVVIDLGGITFSDDRDWKGRALSVGWLLPAVALQKPVLKLAQAIGPFRRFSTRFWAKRLLKHCPLIITRGPESERNVKRLLPDKTGVCQHEDVAFLLQPAPEQSVCEYLNQHGLPTQGYIGLSPSAVIDRKARRRGIRDRYRRTLIGLMNYIRRTRNLPIMMIPHAWPQSGKGTEDLELCLELIQNMKKTDNVFVVRDDLDCRMLKGIIARSEVFIACRFHSMIAALSTPIPTLVIGWGHKYHEIMERFDLDRFSTDFTQMDLSLLCTRFDRLYDRRQSYQAAMQKKLPEMVSSAQQNYQRVREYIDQYILS